MNGSRNLTGERHVKVVRVRCQLYGDVFFRIAIVFWCMRGCGEMRDAIYG